MRKSLFLLVLPLILILSGCESKKDSEYLAQAEKLIKEQKVEEALDEFQQLSAKFPESKLASKSLLEMGKIYQAGMLKDLPRKESLEFALRYFREVNEKYPKSTEAPVALFMTAFILANEMQEFDEAKKNYEQFLKLFPAHELTPSVQSELSTLGMTPEQILSQKDLFGKK